MYPIRGLRRGGWRDPIQLSPGNREKAAWPAVHCDCTVARDHPAVVDGRSQVILATRPDDGLACLDDLRFSGGQTLVGVVAGAPGLTLASADMSPADFAAAIATEGSYSRAGPDLLCSAARSSPGARPAS